MLIGISHLFMSLHNLKMIFLLKASALLSALPQRIDHDVG